MLYHSANSTTTKTTAFDSANGAPSVGISSGTKAGATHRTMQRLRHFNVFTGKVTPGQFGFIGTLLVRIWLPPLSERYLIMRLDCCKLGK